MPARQVRQTRARRSRPPAGGLPPAGAPGSPAVAAARAPASVVLAQVQRLRPGLGGLGRGDLDAVRRLEGEHGGDAVLRGVRVSRLSSNQAVDAAAQVAEGQPGPGEADDDVAVAAEIVIRLRGRDLARTARPSGSRSCPACLPSAACSSPAARPAAARVASGAGGRGRGAGRHQRAGRGAAAGARVCRKIAAARMCWQIAARRAASRSPAPGPAHRTSTAGRRPRRSRRASASPRPACAAASPDPCAPAARGPGWRAPRRRRRRIGASLRLECGTRQLLTR